ncbi:MAG: glycoside hydrolase family 15 protein [Candidatus Dojkabacteria bacterium]
MGKSNILANGQLLVGLDQFAQVDDLYFPYIGLENHASATFTHKIGLMVDNQFTWLDDGKWEFCFNCELLDKRKLITAINTELGIQLKFNDEVYNEKNIFLRGIQVSNLAPRKRTIKIYFNQQFEIYESHRGDTAYYDPTKKVIIHYKGRRLFLVNARIREDDTYFDDYSVDIMDPVNNTGSFKEAENGKLTKRAIEYGLVDSTIGLTINIEANRIKTIDYWLTVSKTMDELKELNEYVIRKTVEYLLGSARDYWKAWTNKIERDYRDLTPDEIWLYERSLEIMRLNTDSTGAIIASVDADLLKYGRDTYSYVWPRDAAMVIMAFAKSGYDDQLRKVFEFFKNIISEEGYFMQKYRADGSLGSSWHPWVYNGQKEYPIQLDETALIVYALWEAFNNEKDVEFLESIYNDLVVKAIDFIITRIDPETGVVKPSYDLWEEVFATSTFASCTVYGALVAASELAKFLGKEHKTIDYANYAEKVKQGILKYHYNEKDKAFYKYVTFLEEEGRSTLKPSEVVDSASFYALHRFGVIDINDERMIHMKNAMHKKLQNISGIGGYPRYENDIYFKNEDTGNGNPWVLTTLWMGQAEIKLAKNLDELKQTKMYLNWAFNHASQGGMLSEQLNANTGEQLSATPLTWSHAEYVVTVVEYLRKYEELSKQTSPQSL